LRTRYKKILTGGLYSVNFLLWPAKCKACGKSINESDELLCAKCWQDLSSSAANEYCPSCGRDVSSYGIIEGKCPECETLDLGFDAIARAGRYGGVLRELLLRIKHTESPRINRLLSCQLYSAASAVLPLDRIDFFTPVPLHWSRKLARGYNQADLLACSFRKNGCCISKVLKRCKRTMPQPGLTYRQKCRNMKNAFKCTRPSLVRGKTICLIDDIKTTGATLSECGRVLKESGAEKIYAAVAAVAHS
jgi:ComF family protein